MVKLNLGSILFLSVMNLQRMYITHNLSAQSTRASLPNLSSPQNVTYPAVLSGFSHAAPAGYVIDAAAWYGYLAGFGALVLLFVALAWSNESIRTANRALSAAASQTHRLFGGLLEITCSGDPDMSAHLREFLEAAQQQGWIPDPYKLDLMAHVELIIGLDGQVTLLTVRNDELSKKYDATLDENLNLRQALALYQDCCEQRDREAICLNMTVDRLNKALASQSPSHLGKVELLAKEYNMTENTNTEQLGERHIERIKNLKDDHKNDMDRQAQQLNERHAEKIKSLRDDHKNDMDDQAHQLRQQSAQQQQLNDKLYIVQEKLRKAEDHLARAFVPIEVRALPLPASDDSDLGDPAGALRNSDHEKAHRTEPHDCSVREKKPTRRRTNAQVQASKRRQQQEHNADGEREATSKAATARTKDPTGDDQQTPREEEQESALSEISSHPNESGESTPLRRIGRFSSNSLFLIWATTGQAQASPVEERSGLDAAGSVAELPVSSTSASSQQQQTSGEALPSSTQSPPPSSPNPRSDGAQAIHGERFGQKDRKSPSQNWISYAEWKKAEKKKEEKEQAELEKEQAEKRSADPASTPASRSASVGGAQDNSQASTSTPTPAAGHQQGFTQPLTSRERRNGGQPTGGSEQQAARGMRFTGNDPGAAFRREFYRHVGLPEDGPGVSSGPPPQLFVQPQPQAPKPRQNKSRSQGARQRRKRENAQGLGKSGAY
ncbi:MAG: hypothetical protein Q9184_003787 [Pyrenodesmia sp. 2 TL-2023]